MCLKFPWLTWWMGALVDDMYLEKDRGSAIL